MPFAIADATTLTEAGYVGDDVENILLRLLQAADFDVERAEHGIIYVDEIDKIARKSENTSITRDVSGEGVQHGPAEDRGGDCGQRASPGRPEAPHQEFIQVNTKNILFICGGAFDGLEKIIERRLDQKSIGFGANVQGKKDKDVSKILHEVQPHDLLKFGIIPELVGRLPVIAVSERPEPGGPGPHPDGAQERPGEAVQEADGVRRGGSGVRAGGRWRPLPTGPSSGTSAPGASGR